MRHTICSIDSGSNHAVRFLQSFRDCALLVEVVVNLLGCVMREDEDLLLAQSKIGVELRTPSAASQIGNAVIAAASFPRASSIQR
jgi:hypothetical protein